MLKQCRYKYYLHYEKDLTSDKSAIALDLGSLIHEILENKGNRIERKRPIHSVEEIQKIYDERLIAIKRKYFDDWYTPDKYGATYDEKLKTFWEYYPNALMDEVWTPSGMEVEFEFVWEDRVRLYGFVDRIDRSDIDGERKIKITDYKTANHCYTGKELHESQQMFIYLLASVYLYNKIPEGFEYDFVFLNEKRSALTKDYSIERCMNNLNNILDEMFSLKESKNYYPTTNPLCHFCDYCKTNPNADAKLKEKCEFHSLWTRNNKTFEVNKGYDKETFNADYEYSGTVRRNLIW